MTKKKTKQPTVKPYRAWLLSNYGNPWVVLARREQARQYAETATGDPWEVCKQHFSIARVEVKPV